MKTPKNRYTIFDGTQMNASDKSALQPLHKLACKLMPHTSDSMKFVHWNTEWTGAVDHLFFPAKLYAASEWEKNNNNIEWKQQVKVNKWQTQFAHELTESPPNRIIVIKTNAAGDSLAFAFTRTRCQQIYKWFICIGGFNLLESLENSFICFALYFICRPHVCAVCAPNRLSSAKNKR